MAFRITMGMKMNTYRYNLMNSNIALNDASEKVQTHRKFNSYAENPADATNAWRVRRNYMDNVSYQNMNKDTYTRFQTAWLSMGAIKTNLEDATGRTAIIRGANDPTAAAKKELGDVLMNTSETIIQGMNGAKYGEEFVFSGTDGTSEPFSWTDDGQLKYRGVILDLPRGEFDSPIDNSKVYWPEKWPKDWGEKIDPDTGVPVDFLKKFSNDGTVNTLQKWDEAEPTARTDPGDGGNLKPALEAPVEPNENSSKYTLADGKFDQAAYDADVAQYKEDVEKYDEWKKNVDEYHEKLGEYESAEDWYNYFQNVLTLNKLSGEKQYSDLGMGMKENPDNPDNDKMIGSTVFNNAIPGINMLGYGVDDDGDPKNLVLLMREMGKMLQSTDEQGNFPGGKEEKDKFFRLMRKYDAASDQTLTGYAEITTQAKFLQSNGDTLEDQGYNLNDQIADLEQVDPADAITQFMWDYSCYSAGLKIGTQLLSQSLIDYMR